MSFALATLLLQDAVLRGEVVDADTGRPIPCRLYMDGPDGKRHVARATGALPSVKERGGGDLPEASGERPLIFRITKRAPRG